jgi:two-component system sensor histidine kinase DesK
MVSVIIGGVYFMISNYIKSNPIEKAQIRWLYIGVGLFIISALVLLYLPLALTGHGFINEQFSFITILFPLSMVFSILRYRLMDIDSLIDNTLIYVITLGLLAFMDIGIVAILINTEFFNISTPVAIAISVWIAAFAYIQIRNFVQKQIKRILKREVYDINQASIQLGKKLFSVNNIKEAFAKTNVIIHETLYPKSSNAYLFNENTYIPIWESKKYNLPLDTDKIKNIKEATPLYKLIDSEMLPDDCSGGVIVPVISVNKIIGYFLFQDKQSDRLYGNEDMKLFAILANQLAMAVEAIHMREELKQKEINDLKEKERISREIHDGIGSRFVDAILLSDVITKDIDNTNKILKHAAELKKTLMEGLTDLRELIWTVEPGQNTLGNIVSYIVDKAQYINNKENIKASVSTSIEDENITISSSIKLNLVRIIQEAITNTIKHAGATKIDVLIEQKNKDLKIEISDNGKGFDSLNMHSKGYGMRNIKKRCEDIGAKISISSEAGKGADITITMELP